MNKIHVHCLLEDSTHLGVLLLEQGPLDPSSWVITESRHLGLVELNRQSMGPRREA